MTELLVPRGDTFPRSFLDSYRSSRASGDQLCYDLKSSRSDELVLQTTVDMPPVAKEMQHGHSESLLDERGGVNNGQVDGVDRCEIMLPKNHRKRVSVYDRVDPEDSIRDIVTENDFYRFVLFKKHYEKYLHLSQKYEEARNIAYYLEEKYHEVKTERDDLLQQRERLSRRLESNECLLREKEDEVFLQLERVVYLEEQCDKLRAQKEMYLQQKMVIEKERDEAYRLLKEQARESESDRRKLESARQEVVHHMTKIKNEKETLERENDQLKEALEAERKGMGRYMSQLQKKQLHSDLEYTGKKLSSLKMEENQSATLSSQFQKAMQHLATCKRRKCSVCAYTRAAFGKISPSHRHKYEHKLLSCIQTPFLEMRNMIRPPPSPIHAEGESLSEWFCPLTGSESPSECSSFSLPFAEMAISYADDTSEASSTCVLPERIEHDRLSPATNNSIKRFGSDSGFSSDLCGDYKSNVTTPKEKFSPKATLDETECAKLTRTKWTASFRKLINRMKK